MSETPQKCAQCNAELPADSSSSLCPKCLLHIGFETQQTDEGEEATGSAYQPAFIPPTAEEIAPQFPQLEILEVLGYGGMGVVYRAKQKELDRIVALKILRPGVSHDPNFAERFQREARALARLNHPNIITVYDFGRRDALFYFVMEFVDGTNLRHLERVGELNPQEALNIVPQICSALQYAHDNGVVHRDIKPENILISTDGEVRIADFGLAKLAGAVDSAPLTGTWQVMGTPHYMAPEQLEKPNTVDHRADIYSLGVVIYELLTGELPLGRFPLPSQKAQVDVRLDEVVLRSLDKEPERRYQHVTDVATAVERANLPPGESKVAQATDWIREKAAALPDAAKFVREKSSGWKSTLQGLLQRLTDHKSLIATLLIWCGAADAALSAFTLTEIPGRLNQDQFVLAVLSTTAAVIALLLGRQLQRNSVSHSLKICAVFALIPWFGFFPPSGFARALLVLFGLLVTLTPSDSAKSADQGDNPDFADRFPAWLPSLTKVLTVRVLSFTVVGLAGWCAICALTFAGIYEFWFQHEIPSTCFVMDSSANDMRPASGAYPNLTIDAGTQQTTKGMLIGDNMLPRERLTIQMPGTSALEVDLNNGVYRMRGGEELTSPLDIRTIAEWMKSAGSASD